MVVATQSAISLTFVYTHRPMSFKVTCHCVVRKWLRAFIIGLILQTPNLGEEEAVEGRGWYRSRALVSSYRPSIVTFPLSLRVSKILPLLYSSTLLFPTNSSLPKLSPCSPGSRWMAFGRQRAKMLS